ncbi:hypothetical protein FA13DRAFT_1751399 [Coprinellus micaceus]|uniref:Uncharacterized protein n=1 Tax=Coprinellus micaceus TaxID=71717 RepID=A0A4Y7TXV2_COPMI|nr:hypothetical protein FA13DRAFT_1751399 [Coprinellus micaceus]
MQTFHYYPYRATWQRAEGEPESELYGEMYSSQAFRVAHNEVQRSPITEENRGLERVVIALMFWSDATQLTSFGGSSLWPCYLFFGNESKHQRGEPSNHLGQHIAYFLKERNQGKLPTDALLTYCKKDLFHKQWSVLLDGELVDAMRDGLVLRCPDGHSRCFYPRIFTYSADYPEKALISGMRNNGGAPCHRCLVKKSNLFHLGAPADVERTSERRNATQEQSDVLEAEQLIQNGYAVNSDKVEDVLKWQSLVPRQTAFARELHGLNFHLPSTLVVDILHEFEIGVWKTLYVHLIRLLEALSTGRDSLTLSAELDAR